MFGSNLKREVESRCLVDVFVGCWVGIWRLDKKIGRRKISHFFSKSKKFSFSYLFTKSLDQHQITNKTHQQGI
jgi:hypothetical protein